MWIVGNKQDLVYPGQLYVRYRKFNLLHVRHIEFVSFYITTVYNIQNYTRQPISWIEFAIFKNNRLEHSFLNVFFSFLDCDLSVKFIRSLLFQLLQHGLGNQLQIWTYDYKSVTKTVLVNYYRRFVVDNLVMQTWWTFRRIR